MASLPAWLVFVHPEDRQKERCVMEEYPFTIGRDAECHLSLDAPGISRLHARIEREFGQYLLSDEHSTNGTFVNDQPVTEKTPLRDGVLIRFAASVEVRFEDPAATDQVDLSELSIRGIQVDQSRKDVFVDGRLLAPPLSPSQYALLEMLVRREGEVVPREDIAAGVWPDEMHITDQMIDTLVSRLRKRLAAHNADQYIVTRRGFGLMFSRE